MEEKRYKDYKVYCFIALNTIASTLDINVEQDGLEEKAADILNDPKRASKTVSKEDIKKEIRSNHHMINKVLDRLSEDGHVVITKEEKGYKIQITVRGLLHLRKFNAFYKEMYTEQLRQHYRYGNAPSWLG